MRYLPAATLHVHGQVVHRAHGVVLRRVHDLGNIEDEWKP